MLVQRVPNRGCPTVTAATILPGRHAQQLLESSSKPNQQRKNFQQPELALPVT
jgi:hypothetical protein